MLQKNAFGQKIFWISCTGSKVPFGNFSFPMLFLIHLSLTFFHSNYFFSLSIFLAFCSFLNAPFCLADFDLLRCSQFFVPFPSSTAICTYKSLIALFSVSRCGKIHNLQGASQSEEKENCQLFLRIWTKSIQFFFIEICIPFLYELLMNDYETRDWWQ